MSDLEWVLPYASFKKLSRYFLWLAVNLGFGSSSGNQKLDNGFAADGFADRAVVSSCDPNATKQFISCLINVFFIVFSRIRSDAQAIALPKIIWFE